jgi:hypothetical protein
MYHNYNTHMYIFLLFIFVKIGTNFMDIYFPKKYQIRKVITPYFQNFMF